MPQTKRHKVFISFHHDDQKYKDRFVKMMGDNIIDRSVDVGDIVDGNLPLDEVRQRIRDNFIADATVTIVLVGRYTWKRKHVDWEIGASIRETEYNPRSGLLGILLPNYPRPQGELNNYLVNTIPPRLHDNIECEFAKIYNWIDNPNLVQSWIHEAFNRRKTINPDNSYPSFVNNRSGERW